MGGMDPKSVILGASSLPPWCFLVRYRKSKIKPIRRAIAQGVLDPLISHVPFWLLELILIMSIPGEHRP